MSHEIQVESCRAYLHSALLGRERMPGRKESGPVITISRQSGARGNSLAAELAGKLTAARDIPRLRPWTVFNQNLIQHVIDEHHLPERTADYFHEDRRPEDVRAIIGEILGLHPGVYNTRSKTAETIRHLAEQGNTIIVGRGGNFITADIKRSVHVRLVGSETVRARHIARRDGLNHAEALAKVRATDRARKRYIKRVFSREIDDAEAYDLTLNTDRFSDEQAAELIISALRQRIG